MSKSIKLISVLLMATMVIISLSNVVCATTAADVLNTVQSGTSLDKVQGGSDLQQLVGKIISLLQYIAIIGGALILAVLGIKYMMGSVEEKAEYKKTMSNYIIGAMLLFGITTIANIFYTIGTKI